MSEPRAENLSLPESLLETLRKHDASPDDLDQAEPSYDLESQLKECKEITEGHRKAAFAEVAALQMDLLPNQQRSRWNTRFGPILETIKKDGTYHCFPDIAQIDNAVIAYLDQRVSQATHPALKARYADFLWDITSSAIGKKPSIEWARQAIDAYIDCGRRFPTSHVTDERLMRALELALSVRDSPRLDQVVNTMLGLLDQSERPGSHVLWLFDVLYDQKGVSLSDDQQSNLIVSLEKELERICGSDQEVGFAAKEPALRLARHYERTDQSEEVKRVIRAYGHALGKFAMKAEGLVAMDWLQEVYATFLKFGMKEEAEEFQVAAKEKGKEAEGQMAHQSFSVEIPKAEIEIFLEEITAGDLESTLRRLAVDFCPRIDDLRKHLAGVKQKAKMLSMVSQSKMGEQQVIARAGPIDSDPEGRLMFQMAEHVQWVTSLLTASIDRMRSKYEFSPETMREFLSKSLLFEESRIPLFEHAIKAYLADDHVTTIHVLVPQIEHSLRTLLASLHKPTNKHRRADPLVMVEKTLNDILEKEPVIPEFLGEDFTLYLRMFLCDPRGYNVRNNLSHGLMEPSQFTRGISDRLLHIVWSLGFVRSGTASPSKS